MAQRYKFYNRTQNIGESLDEYLSGIKRMTEYCEFGEFQAEAIRDKFVCGMNNAKIRTRLLAKKDLTLDTATTLALSIEDLINQNELIK